MPIILKGKMFTLNGKDIFFRGIDEKGIKYNVIPLEPLTKIKKKTLDGCLLKGGICLFLKRNNNLT